MNQLLPIIRRVRRPLIQAKAETLKPEMLKEGPAEAVTPNVEVGNIEPSTLNIEPRTGEKVAAPLANVPPKENSDAKVSANQRKAR